MKVGAKQTSLLLDEKLAETKNQECIAKATHCPLVATIKMADMFSLTQK